MAVNLSITELCNWTFNSKINLTVYSPIIMSITSLLSTIGLIGNFIVIWFLSCKIRRNFSTTYILNLALADTIFLLSVLLMHISWTVIAKPDFEIGDLDIYLIYAINTMSATCLFGYNSSLSLLTIISMERCLSVLFPIWYRCKRPKRLSILLCSIMWLLSCLLTALEISFCYKQIHKPQELENACNAECNVIFVIICCLGFIIFVPLMIASNVILLMKVWTSSKKRQAPRLYVVVMLTVLFFLVLAIPMRILLLVLYKHHIMTLYPVMDIITMLCSLNSSVNPFIYFLVGHQCTVSGKRNLVVIFETVFHDERSQCKMQPRAGIKSKDTLM